MACRTGRQKYRREVRDDGIRRKAASIHGRDYFGPFISFQPNDVGDIFSLI